MTNKPNSSFIAALLAPLPEGEGFDAAEYLDRCAIDDRIAFWRGFNPSDRRNEKGGAA